VSGILEQVSRSNGGLPKLKVEGPVMLHPLGIAGDRQRNTLVHGGPRKAVLLIAAEAIDDLRARGYPLTYGSLGENLTVSGLDRRLWRAGQRYRVGEDVHIELTKLRSPCLNLDVYGPNIQCEIYDARCKAGDPESPVWAMGGFYARVIRPGLLVAGAPITLLSDIA
jgi:MOSC domain-containing protein YiiM